MDSPQLAFIDNQFERANAYFLLMYMNASEIIIEEVYSVLKYDGSFEIWDNKMPSVEMI